MQPDSNHVHILGFAGSLREGSYNRAALRAAVELAPAGMTLETFDLSPIPLYNDDVRRRGYPPPVQEFREKIVRADGLLIVTPEYNYSIPGVLKNAIDWASRPPNPPLSDKPVAVMGVTSSYWGTVRAQLHLRQIFVFTNMHPVNMPQVLINNAAEKFVNGKLTDEQSRQFIAELLEALREWTLRLNGSRAVPASSEPAARV